MLDINSVNGVEKRELLFFLLLFCFLVQICYLLPFYSERFVASNVALFLKFVMRNSLYNLNSLYSYHHRIMFKKFPFNKISLSGQVTLEICNVNN